MIPHAKPRDVGKNKKAEELAMESIVEGDKEFKERIEPSNATLSTFDFLRKEVTKATRQQTPILFCCDCKTNYALICGECNKKELEATMQQTAKEILNAVQANLVWSDYNFKAFRKIKKKYLSESVAEKRGERMNDVICCNGLCPFVPCKDCPNCEHFRKEVESLSSAELTNKEVKKSGAGK